MTAWFGLRRVAELRPGDRVLVTSAAGPVGATAGQLAKLWGAGEVVGIAGGPDKCKWLTEVAGFDRAIDYKAPGFEAEFAEASAAGWDVLFDNVGNAMIDRTLPHMKLRGRIVVSGQVADYNTPVEQTPGLKHTREFIAKRLRMEGLVVFDDLPHFAAAQAELAGLHQVGHRQIPRGSVRRAGGAARSLLRLVHRRQLRPPGGASLSSEPVPAPYRLCNQHQAAAIGDEQAEQRQGDANIEAKAAVRVGFAGGNARGKGHWQRNRPAPPAAQHHAMAAGDGLQIKGKGQHARNVRRRGRRVGSAGW